MAIINRIYDALDDFGMITSAEARQLGVSNKELVNQACRGKLKRVARGVYRVPVWPYQEAFPYALAVKAAGHDAVLYGESVLGLLGLAPANPSRMQVATTSRTRRMLGKGTTIARIQDDEKTTHYEGIPCQSADRAILASVKTIGRERAHRAALEAKRLGYISAEQLNTIIKEVGHGEAPE